MKRMRGQLRAKRSPLEPLAERETGDGRQPLAAWDDWRCLGHLMRRMLIVDPEQRIEPEEALQHPFFTFEFLQPATYRNYHDLLAQAYAQAHVSVQMDYHFEFESFEVPVRQMAQRRKRSLLRRQRLFFSCLSTRKNLPAATQGDEDPMEGPSNATVPVNQLRQLNQPGIPKYNK